MVAFYAAPGDSVAAPVAGRRGLRPVEQGDMPAGGTEADAAVGVVGDAAAAVAAAWD